jgi:N-acetylglucosaminyldiphosphoundecaprenol N-acetyl-beta-D-mannosaminyltransferase
MRDPSSPVPPPPRRVDVLGVPVDCVDMPHSLALVRERVAGDRVCCILAVNPEKVIAAQSEAVLRRALEGAGLLIPDGIGVVWAVRLLWKERLARVPGAELMPAICADGAARGYRLFLFGAGAEVNAEAVAALRRRYPGIDIVGHHHGYVDDAGMGAVIEAINRAGANVLFVALGSPKQELWMEKHLPQLPAVRICQGVGGTFDVIAGRVRRAPAFWRRTHLEWLYRLLAEPRRLLRQTALPRFAWRVLRARLAGPSSTVRRMNRG